MLEDRSSLKPFHSFALWKWVNYFDALDTNAMTGSKKHIANHQWSDDQFNHRFTVHQFIFINLSLPFSFLWGHMVFVFLMSVFGSKWSLSKLHWKGCRVMRWSFFHCHMAWAKGARRFDVKKSPRLPWKGTKAVVQIHVQRVPRCMDV